MKEQVFVPNTPNTFALLIGPSSTIVQCDICDYGCFQVDIKTHEKETWRRETSLFFSKHTLSVHRIYSNVIFVTISVFKLILKHMKN